MAWNRGQAWRASALLAALLMSPAAAMEPWWMRGNHTLLVSSTQPALMRECPAGTAITVNHQPDGLRWWVRWCVRVRP